MPPKTQSALSLSDVTAVLNTADYLASLSLSVQTAQQIIVGGEASMPSRPQLQLLPWRDVDILLDLWGKAQHQQPDIAWNVFLDLLVEHLATSANHIVTVKIPYQPTLQQLDELTQILRSSLIETAVLDIKHQPELVAGCIVESQGQRYDFSAETWLPAFLAATDTTQTTSLPSSTAEIKNDTKAVLLPQTSP